MISSTERRLETACWISDDPPDRSLDRSVGDALHSAAASWADRLALIDPQSDATWTFADLDRGASAVARCLTEQFAPGDRLAVWAANCPEWILLEFGAALAGIVLVTVNPAYRDAEVRFVLEHSRANAVVVQPTLRDRNLLQSARTVAAHLPDLRTVLTTADVLEYASTSITRRLPDVVGADPVQIQYTSGTTGLPKGALLRHRGVAANGRLFAEAIGAREGDVWVNPMPLFHTAGCGLITLGALQTGGTQVLPARFDADQMLDLFAAHAGSVLLSVPTMLIRMLEAQRRSPRNVETWRLSALGGAPVPTELVTRAERELGVAVTIGFGQTEASPYLTHTRPDDPNPRWAETVGRPLEHIDVRICRDDGSTAEVDEDGEICTRSICVMQGYYGDSEATRAAIDDDGWLHTGDIGAMDEHGYVRVRGRLRDMIIRGGENIYPREIEDMLFTHPAIAGVAVVGLPHSDWGEIAAAFIRSTTDITADELRTWMTGRLATYKVPHVWVFVDEFPETASGKIQKFALRESYLRGDGPVA